VRERFERERERESARARAERERFAYSMFSEVRVGECAREREMLLSSAVGLFCAWIGLILGLFLDFAYLYAALHPHYVHCRA
jgi:hypothetical protein